MVGGVMTAMSDRLPVDGQRDVMLLAAGATTAHPDRHSGNFRHAPDLTRASRTVSFPTKGKVVTVSDSKQTEITKTFPLTSPATSRLTVGSRTNFVNCSTMAALASSSDFPAMNMAPQE